MRKLPNDELVDQFYSIRDIDEYTDPPTAAAVVLDAPLLRETCLTRSLLSTGSGLKATLLQLEVDTATTVVAVCVVG